MNKINVAVVGLGFGAEFVPIFMEHPDVNSVTICDGNPELLQTMSDRFGIKDTFNELTEVFSRQLRRNASFLGCRFHSLPLTT